MPFAVSFEFSTKGEDKSQISTTDELECFIASDLIEKKKYCLLIIFKVQLLLECVNFTYNREVENWELDMLFNLHLGFSATRILENHFQNSARNKHGKHGR